MEITIEELSKRLSTSKRVILKIVRENKIGKKVRRKYPSNASSKRYEFSEEESQQIAKLLGFEGVAKIERINKYGIIVTEKDGNEVKCISKRGARVLTGTSTETWRTRAEGSPCKKFIVGNETYISTDFIKRFMNSSTLPEAAKDLGLNSRTVCDYILGGELNLGRFPNGRYKVSEIDKQRIKEIQLRRLPWARKNAANIIDYTRELGYNITEMRQYKRHLSISLLDDNLYMKQAEADFRDHLTEAFHLNKGTLDKINIKHRRRKIIINVEEGLESMLRVYSSVLRKQSI